MASPITGAGLGALGGMAAKLMLKTSLTVLLNTRPIVVYLASEAYREETGKDFNKLSVTDQTIWTNRVQSIIRAAGNTV